MEKKYDQTLLITTILLFMIGMIMVYSSSWPVSIAEGQSANYISLRQFIFGMIGIAVMLILMVVPYYKFNNGKVAGFIYFASLGAVALVHSPLGVTVNYATRWIEVLGIRFMPSDLLKFGTILICAYYINENKNYIHKFSRGFVPMLFFAALSGILVYSQPDLSTAMVIMGSVILMFLVAGIKLKYFSLSVLLMGIFGFVAIFFSNSAYSRISRLLAFTDPLAHREDEAWQLVQSLFAVSSGRFLGVGIGKSSQKYFYLSQGHSDFIFAILAEELGFVGAMLVIILFLILIYRGLAIGMKCKDIFGRYMAFGITFTIGLQAFLNIAVVIGMVPPTGITLPFISQGGTSLVFFLALVGILQNIYMTTNNKERLK